MPPGTQAFRATSSFADTKRRPPRRLRHSTLSGTIGEPDFRQFRTGVRGKSPTRVVKALSGMNSQAERWTFLTSHTRVLLTLARDPTSWLHGYWTSPQHVGSPNALSWPS
jgi:hypothetical protein